MDECPELPTCSESEGITIFCCLYAVSADRSLVLPVQQGEQILLLRPLQPGNRKVVRQQRGQVGVAPEVKGQGFENEVKMPGKERFQQRERGFFTTRSLTGDSESSPRLHRQTPAPLLPHALCNDRPQAHAERLVAVLSQRIVSGDSRGLPHRTPRTRM